MVIPTNVLLFLIITFSFLFFFLFLVRSDINERRGPWTCECSLPQIRGMPGQGSRSVCIGEQQEGMG